MSGTFQHKYRPQKFEDLAGNEEVVSALSKIFAREREKIPHAFLFTGPAGCGKTTIARIIRQELECSDEDFKEFNASNTRGIEFIRDITANVWFSPMSGKVKVYLLDECHMLTKDAQEALLKALEDPPKHVYFILCTTDPEMLKKSFKSRCHHMQVNSLPNRKMVPYLKELAKKEGDSKFPDEVIKEISKASEGCVRDAVKMLDLVWDMDDIDEMIKVVQSTTSVEDRTKELIQTILDSKGKRWEICKDILKNLDEDPEKVRRAILGYLRSVMLTNGGDRIAEIMGLFMDPFYNSGSPGLVHTVYLACKI